MNGQPTRRRAQEQESTGNKPDPGKQYLLFAGSKYAAPAGVLVGRFNDELRARHAFVNQRLSSARPDAWARLEAVDVSGRASALCWFGPLAHFDGADGASKEEQIRGIRPRVPSPSLTPRARGERPFCKSAVAALGGTVLLAVSVIGGHCEQPWTRPPSPSLAVASGALVGYEAVETKTETYAPRTDAPSTRAKVSTTSPSWSEPSASTSMPSIRAATWRERATPRVGPLTPCRTAAPCR